MSGGLSAWLAFLANCARCPAVPFVPVSPVGVRSQSVTIVRGADHRSARPDRPKQFEERTQTEEERARTETRSVVPARETNRGERIATGRTGHRQLARFHRDPTPLARISIRGPLALVRPARLSDGARRSGQGSFVQRETILPASAPGTHITTTFAPAGPVLWRILSGGFT